MYATPPAVAFVNVLGRVSLVLAIVGTAWALLQLLLGMVVPDALVDALAMQGITPPLLVRLVEWRHALALGMLALSLLLAAAAWGLLKRQEWARLAFVALLVLGAVANFAGLAAIDPFFDSLEALFPPPVADNAGGPAFAGQFQSARRMAWVTGAIGALAAAGLHGWVAWKLCSAPVRAWFEHRRG